MLTVKPDELRAIMGDGMTDRMWEATTNHAKTCVPDDKYPPQQLNTDQRTFVPQLTLEAYDIQLPQEASDHDLQPWLTHPVCQTVSSEPSVTTLTSVSPLFQDYSGFPYVSPFQASSSSLGHSFGSPLEATKAGTEADPNADILDELDDLFLAHLT